MIIQLQSRIEPDLRNYLQISAHLRSIADYFETFTDIDKCIDFISSLVHEKVFLIVSLTGAEQLIPLIHDLSQLGYIYICNETGGENVSDKVLEWINDFPVIRNGVYKLDNSLFDQLQHDVKVFRQRLVPFTLFSTASVKNNSIQNLNKEQASYRWNQLLLDALRKLPQNDKSKQDILNDCKTQYCNNKPELEKIEQFEKTYRPQLAVWWYTRDCFLHKLLNKAFRTEDIDIVFKFRFFITDLYNQLTDLHNQSKSEKSNILTVYRGQQLAPDELEVFKHNINGFISMNTFLSTTTNKDVALIYAGDGSERPLFESVLFEIIIDVNKSDQPLADISKISHMLHEDEVLLSMGMIFTVKSVEQIDNNVWQVKLTSTNEANIQMSDYHKYLKEDVERSNEPLLKFGSLLFEMGQYDKEEKYYLMLLDEGTDNYGPVYNNLGLCYYAKNNYRRALDYYTKTLNHYIMTDCDKKPYCTQTYNNIGVIYKHKEDYKQALEFHYKALEIHLEYPKTNIRGFILTLKHIGKIYEEFGNYDEALKKYSHALNIADTSLPKNHPDTAMIYSCIGSVHLHLGQYDESMKNYKKALRIKQETLPNDHPYIASSVINIGYVHDLKEEYDHALDHYKQAHEILTKLGIIGRLELATVYGNMGVVYSKKGEYILALDCQQKCLEIRKQFYSEHIKIIATTYSNIGIVYNKMNNIEKAIEYTEKAIDIIRNSQLPDDPDLGLIYNNMGLNYEKLGNVEQALHYFNLSLDIKYHYFPVNHPTFGTTFDNIALLLTKTGDIPMAIYYEEKALKIFEESLDANHPRRVGCMNDLAILKTLERRTTR
jgi:tetratricopeptide (TPR) repeat protein